MEGDGPGYDAVVFDNDGVLTHPTDRDLLIRAAEAAFSAAGVDDPDEEHLVAVNDGRDALADICAEYGLDPETLWRHHEHEKAAAQRAALLEGSKPLYDDVDAVRDLPARRGIVSNNQHATVESIVEVFGLGDAFETYYGREPSLDGIRRRKPDPYYIERALDDLGTRDALYVGDSRVDIEAARRAGVDAAFVRRPHREGYDLPADPDYRIDGLDDLVPIVAGERPAGERSAERP